MGHHTGKTLIILVKEREPGPEELAYVCICVCKFSLSVLTSEYVLAPVTHIT